SLNNNKLCRVASIEALPREGKKRSSWPGEGADSIPSPTISPSPQQMLGATPCSLDSTSSSAMLQYIEQKKQNLKENDPALPRWDAGSRLTAATQIENRMARQPIRYCRKYETTNPHQIHP
ncbi:unnamed protein product, partial [Ectocarpus sp. 6 AP-2014]